MGIFDQYGIKEVADVTIYSIHKKKDGSGDVYYIPALYLDTLKVSSTEQTAENVWATGGLGNARLINWDYGKALNLTLEDALCTPASLGLCWGGILSSDWKGNQLEYSSGIRNEKQNPIEKISRFEKGFYPRNDKAAGTVSRLLPQLDSDNTYVVGDEPIITSSIIDGLRVRGFGRVQDQEYQWNLVIETDIKSCFVLPEKFFDIYGRSYKLLQNKAIAVNVPVQNDIKYEVTYAIDTTSTTSSVVSNTMTYNGVFTPASDLLNKNFLKIIVYNNGRYEAQVTDNITTGTWVITNQIDLELFKGIDMFQRFENINELVYFILTKYEDNIYNIIPKKYVGITSVTGNDEFSSIDEKTGEEILNKTNEVWCYINPKTMKPYPDYYWFHQGEPYYIKSLTFAPEKKKLKAKRIEIKQAQFPGMYMIVGETYIRSRDTGEDERMQFKIPLCKIRSNQTLTLQADGDPTVFNMEVEVAKPKSGVLMEITTYETAEKLIDVDGVMIAKDGSRNIIGEDSHEMPSLI